MVVAGPLLEVNVDFIYTGQCAEYAHVRPKYLICTPMPIIGTISNLDVCASIGMNVPLFQAEGDAK